MDDIKSQMLRLEIMFENNLVNGNTKDPCKNNAVQMADLTKLQSFGVPINCKSELDTLEMRLKDKNFLNEMVRLFLCFMI